jgi:hypothetical protein
MLRIEPRLAFINGVLLANRVLIFRFQLLAVLVLNCSECCIDKKVQKILLVEKDQQVLLTTKWVKTITITKRNICIHMH